MAGQIRLTLAHYQRDVEHLMRMRKRILSDSTLSRDLVRRALSDIDRLAKTLGLLLKIDAEIPPGM
jgi:hypothetical protein